MKIKVFLSMKNAKAIGIYNLETRSITVLAGAQFERVMSKSFQNHNYRKLRDDLIGKKLLDDNYILLKDYEFNSLSSAAAVIGGRSAAGTIEWKLEDGTRVGDYEASKDTEVTNEDINKKYSYIVEFLENIQELDQLNDITKFNLFETLSIVNNEIRHSNVLAWLMDPSESHNLGDYFLKMFIRDAYIKNKKVFINQNLTVEDVVLWEYDQARVLREKDNIDILIKDDENRLVIAIENKIDSLEHDDQLNKYKEIITSKYSNYKHMLVYLTKEGSESSDPDCWGTYSYEDIVELVKKAIPKSNESVSSFLKDYIDIIRRITIKSQSQK